MLLLPAAMAITLDSRLGPVLVWWTPNSQRRFAVVSGSQPDRYPVNPRQMGLFSKVPARLMANDVICPRVPAPQFIEEILPGP
jgi:hypothetical protein